jgi:hypothetical protein
MRTMGLLVRKLSLASNKLVYKAGVHMTDSRYCDSLMLQFDAATSNHKLPEVNV